ncbi:hypothetical protein IPU75_05160 [Ochrobactrum sp. SD129]|nr:hypothetical protein [Ochrobactrum sp. SD129]
MALSNVEKVRAYRERQKAKEKAELKMPTKGFDRAVMQTEFWKAFQADGNATDIQLALDIAGIEMPPFDDDSDPKSASGEIERGFLNDGTPEDSPYFKGGGSLARAEIMVGSLIDAASAMAGVINNYKRAELDARIAEIEQSDLSDPAAKKQAFASMARLNKMRDQLEKQVRWTFPQWKVTGE